MHTTYLRRAFAPASSRNRGGAVLRVLFALIGLLCLCGLRPTASAQTVVNPSFEADPRPPGNGDGPITGWPVTSGPGGASGINTVTGPFTDNGMIPDGQKVAFIYHSGTMHQIVSGFSVGAQYVLRFYENARDCCVPRTANLQVTVGGVTVVPTHEVPAVGGTNPYVQKTSASFTANAGSLDIAFITSGSGDFTVLLDKVEVSTNIVVTNNADSGAGSLRQAVLDAPPGSTITFSDAVRGTISLTTGYISINKNLTIAGPGADVLTIRNGAGNGNNNRVINVNAGITAVLSGLTISDGYADAGGGILNAGNLTVRNAVIRNNHTFGLGGGISSGGTLTLVNSIVTRNEESVASPLNGISQGGGINFAGSSLTITDSTVSDNGADEGGGIYVDIGGSVSMTNSTISGNYVYNGPGGGIYLLGNVMATLTNCTVSQNSVSTLENSGDANEGGGIFVRDASTLTLINSTIANNKIQFTDPVDNPIAAGGGIANGSFSTSGGTVNVRNSIIAGNFFVGSAGSIALDFHGTLTSQGYNLIGSNRFTQIVGVTTGNIVGTQAAPINARFGPLGFYGGPTQTHALLTGSPAINAGNTATSPATDQRGAARVGTADMGAFEVNNSANGGTFRAQLPDGVVHTPYAYTLVPNNGTFTYSLTAGALPNGITLTTNPAQNGVVALSGTPTAVGTYNFSITASNGKNTNVTNYTLTIVPATQAPSITSANSTTFVVGTAGTFTLAATGAPTPILSQTGALPSGVTFTPASGVLSGTPAAGTGGTYPLTFTASNGVGSAAVQNFTLIVNQAPAITSSNSTTFVGGSAGTFTVTKTGFPTPTLSQTGTLPSGVTLNAATGVLSGTPAAGSAGSYPITFTATNGVAPNATQSFTLTVNQPPAITSGNATAFVVGTAGTFMVTTTGFPTPTLSQTSTLPSGVTFTPTSGVLSGTPAAGTGGTYPITFTASNGIGSAAVQNFTLTVNQAPAITSANSTTFVAGTFGSFTVMKTGTPTPAVSRSGALPPGVSFISATGVLSGTPAPGAFGTYALVFTASNGVGSTAVQNFSLVVNPSAQDVRSKPKIAANPGGGYRSSFVGNPGQQYTVQFSPDLQPANWQFLGVQTAGADGTFFIIDNPPAGTRQRFYRAIIPTGWTAQYYKDAGDGSHLVGSPLATRRDATIDFTDASGWAETLVPGLGVDRFSVRWSGQFLAPATANYTFYTTSDDGVRLSIDGQTLIDNWTDHAPTVNSVTVGLDAGEFYPIVLEFYENAGGAVISLEYEASAVGIARQIVPPDRVN